jgi:hypothetical protein
LAVTFIFTVDEVAYAGRLRLAALISKANKIMILNNVWLILIFTL